MRIIWTSFKVAIYAHCHHLGGIPHDIHSHTHFLTRQDTTRKDPKTVPQNLQREEPGRIAGGHRGLCWPFRWTKLAYLGEKSISSREFHPVKTLRKTNAQGRHGRPTVKKTVNQVPQEALKNTAGSFWLPLKPSWKGDSMT